MRFGKTCGGAIVLAISFTVVSGCTPQRLGYDHRQMRRELLEAYDQQLLDNLIRAKRGEPLLHVRYGEIKGTAETKATLSGTIADEDSDSIDINSNLSTTDKDNSNLSGEVAIASTMEVVGTPVLDDPELYKAYRDFAKAFLRQGASWESIPAGDEVILFGDRRARVPGGGWETAVYWLPAKLDGVDVREQLSLLVDRTMFAQKKPSMGPLPSKAKVVVVHAEQPSVAARLNPERVIEIGVRLAPAFSMVHGQIELSESLKLSVGGGIDNHVKSTATATLIVVPDDVGDSVDLTVPRSAKVYASRSEIEQIARIAGSTADPAEWLVGRLLGKSHSMAYQPPRDPSTDLNEMVEALTVFLKKVD